MMASSHDVHVSPTKEFTNDLSARVRRVEGHTPKYPPRLALVRHGAIAPLLQVEELVTVVVIGEVGIVSSRDLGEADAEIFRRCIDCGVFVQSC